MARKRTHSMVTISITMGSYTNDLDERGSLVVRDHDASSVLLTHIIHHQHPVSEGGRLRGADEPKQYMIIDSEPLFRLLHFCS